MDGKKFALTVVGITVAIALLIVIVIQLFFKFYEPKTSEQGSLTSYESSLLTPQQAPTIITLNSR